MKLVYWMVVLNLFAAVNAFGWGDLGHEAVGEIGERNLSPEAKKMVQSILGVEPLAVAATFPDHVRSDPRYKAFAPYHFIEIPEGFDYESLPPQMRAEKDANTIISQVPALLKDPNVSRDRKAILLRYLIHVVGDVHQPLHVGNGRDMGANLCDVMLEDSKGQLRKTKFHELWDSELMYDLRRKYFKAQGTSGFGRWFGYQEVSDTVLKDVYLTDADRQRMITLDPLAWYKDSVEERKKLYPDASPIADPKDRPYCKYLDPQTKKIVDGAYDPTKLPRLGEEYKTRAVDTLERQLVKGGLRLAALLNDTAKSYRGSREASESESEILAGVQLKNPKVDDGAQPHLARRDNGGTH